MHEISGWSQHAIVIGSDKGDHFALFPNFHLKCLYLWSFELELWQEYSSIILLHLQEFPAPPTSGLGGAIARVDHIQKSPFYASLWQLTAQDNRIALASNVESVK